MKLNLLLLYRTKAKQHVEVTFTPALISLLSIHPCPRQDHPPVLNQLDSSSNPSSTTSSTPSSPAPFQQSNPPSATPPPNPSPKGHRDSRFNFPGEPHRCIATKCRYCTDTYTYRNVHAVKSLIQYVMVWITHCTSLLTPKNNLLQSFSNQCSLPATLVTYFLSFAKAACYFQHRQQFIFPGELTVPELCAALLFSHCCSTLQNHILPAALSVLCMFAFRVVAVSVVSQCASSWNGC